MLLKLQMIHHMNKLHFQNLMSKRNELLKIGMLSSLFFIPMTYMTIQQQMMKLSNENDEMIATCSIHSMIMTHKENTKIYNRDYICKMTQSDNSIMLNEQNVQYNGYEYKMEKFTKNGQILLYTKTSN